MTSGASWLKKTTFWEARDLPVNLARQSSSLQSQLIQVVKRETVGGDYTPQSSSDKVIGSPGIISKNFLGGGFYCLLFFYVHP